MAKFDSPAVAMERRRTTVQEDGANRAGLVRITHTIDVPEAGESAIDVNFPMAFVEEPATWFGMVYQGNGTLSGYPASEWTPGQMPVFSCCVLGWTRDQRNISLYVGATLGIICQGANNDTYQVQAHFEAKAVRSGGAV